MSTQDKTGDQWLGNAEKDMFLQTLDLYSRKLKQESDSSQQACSIILLAALH
jgi:hypothetical protein